MTQTLPKAKLSDVQGGLAKTALHQAQALGRQDAAIEKMQSALMECETYFDKRADIANEHDEDGSPRPNEEMRLLAEVREALRWLKALGGA